MAYWPTNLVMGWDDWWKNPRYNSAGWISEYTWLIHVGGRGILGRPSSKNLFLPLNVPSATQRTTFAIPAILSKVPWNVLWQEMAQLNNLWKGDIRTDVGKCNDKHSNRICTYIKQLSAPSGWTVWCLRWARVQGAYGKLVLEQFLHECSHIGWVLISVDVGNVSWHSE